MIFNFSLKYDDKMTDNSSGTGLAREGEGVWNVMSGNARGVSMGSRFLFRGK